MKVIDYRDLYENLKDRPAKYWDKETELFRKLFGWKMNDTREDDRGC